MIERKFVAQKIKEHEVQEFIASSLSNVGHSHTKMIKTPLGEKIIIYASRPGLVVGRKGQNIKLLTRTLKKQFNLENPQIEISEVEAPGLDANIIAERITDSLEHFGSQKFKAICHKAMGDVMRSGALGVEILISGKVPSDRAKSWRFYSGYLKKCGDIAISGVRHAHLQANLKTGVVGVKVSIMPPDTKLPDNIQVQKEITTEEGEVKEQPSKEESKESKEDAPKESEETSPPQNQESTSQEEESEKVESQSNEN